MHKLTVIVLALVLTACAAEPELIGVDNPEIPVANVAEATKRTVFIASTRERSDQEGALFSTNRSDTVALASVTVSIPPTHEIGKIERPKRLPPDPRKEFAIVDPVVFGNDQAFVRSINSELSMLPPGERDILFFVHGYNNTTSDAALRLAQFVEDSGYNGVPVLFDWASAAQLKKYVFDLNSVLIARESMRGLGALLGQTKADGYDIFGHSMGTLLTMEAMRDASLRGVLNQSGRLKNIVLASPDIDLDLFRAQLKEINSELDIFVLLSRDDRALRVSRVIAGGVPRVGAGNAEELAKLGVVVVDLSEIEDSSSGTHSKFAGSPEIVKILGAGLNRHSRFDDALASTRLDEILLTGLPIAVLF